MPASLPTVDPKSLNGSVNERLQYGLEAVSAATAVNVRRMYDVLSLPLPEPSRVTMTRDAAYVARPIRLPSVNE
jgi:hypothetical protein